MKKFICIFLTLTLSLCLLAGCGNTQNENKTGNKSIVVTVYPVYDWIMNILGDKASQWDVTLLLDSGVDLHSYQPTADDMVKIASCDLFVYVGGNSDKWVDDALKTSAANVKSINLMSVLGDRTKKEEVVEGMQAEEEEGEEEGPEYDEHIWLSLKNARICCQKITENISSVDNKNESAYNLNYTAYSSKLNDLDSKYDEMVKASSNNTLLFGDRFPFRYLTDDYSIRYYAAFVGCSAESEASFKTVSFLSKKVDELGLKYVIALEGSDQKISKTIISNTSTKNQKILVMDSLQSATLENADKEGGYLSVMEKNFLVLKEALS